MFRNLRADEIEVRVQSCKQNGCVLLLYKDARCDMNILDETVTPMNWKREHARDNRNCIVSIWDEVKKQWISKEDTGSESNTEAQKGLASDSFKRACFNWGIGRELYSAPFTWVNLNSNEVSQYDGKYKLDFKVKFRVSEIETTDNKHITKLVIVDQNNNIRFSIGSDKKPQSNNYINKVEQKFEGEKANNPTDEIRFILGNWNMPENDRQSYRNNLNSGAKKATAELVKEFHSKYGSMNGKS